jgi:hypothetical protein
VDFPFGSPAAESLIRNLEPLSDNRSRHKGRPFPGDARPGLLIIKKVWFEKTLKLNLYLLFSNKHIIMFSIFISP